MRDLLNRQGSNSGLRKISVACKTCGVSESFYSSVSIKKFKLGHIDHEVIEGNADAPNGGPRTEPPGVMQDAENGGKVRLLKVMVELVMLPAYPAPVFTITGVKEDLKSAFVQVVSPSQRDQVKETLEKGKYLDSGSTDTVYVWEPKAISFSEDATLAMSFGSSSPAGSIPPEPRPATEGPSRSDSRSTSEDDQEVQIPASGGEQPALAIEEVAPQTEAPVLLVLPGPSDSAASQPPSDSSPRLDAPSSGSAQASTVAARSSLELEAPSKPSNEPREVSTPAKSAGEEAAATSPSEGSQHTRAGEDNYLLVSRSWYIEGGTKNLGEAVRISRLLRPFRWKIEPAYTIGVMVDDILSIETANGEIGGDMTKRVEGAGYKFSRVSVERGKPVAWFKKEPASARDALGR
jgi:hypothetical protein